MSRDLVVAGTPLRELGTGRLLDEVRRRRDLLVARQLEAVAAAARRARLA